uniref:Yip1 domain-containing protein n=1 Tax=Candidatus Kentrum sp. LFY TaxID=2126342 RepID=A0A450WVK8_9GAMM|nr:MAG: hypothetical protein BECKLFY1418C_GA0070996_108416 [Candidatus Kentron sp. LFY]
MTNRNNHEDSNTSISGFFIVWVKEAFNTLKDYFLLIEKSYLNDQIAEEIRENRVDIKLLVRALFGSIIITSFIDLLFSDSAEGSVDGFIESFIIVVLIFISAALIHAPLKWVGGKASFRQTFFADLAVSIISFPVISIVLVVSAWLGIDEKHAGYISTILFIPIISSVHQISHGKVLGAMFIIFLGVMLLVALVALVA